MEAYSARESNMSQYQLQLSELLSETDTHVSLGAATLPNVRLSYMAAAWFT
jgi:hypothetical protein